MARIAFGSLVLALLLPLAVGCTGESEQLLVRKDLPQLVLQPEDLPGQWSAFDEGRQLRADALPGARADPARFGRVEGWKARYRRPGSRETEGPLVVESRADLFAEVSGAEEDFDAVVEGLAGENTVETIELGDEARALQTGGEEGQFTTVTVVWREQNVVAALTANGFGGKLETADLVALARKQHGRFGRALG